VPPPPSRSPLPFPSSSRHDRRRIGGIWEESQRTGISGDLFAADIRANRTLTRLRAGQRRGRAPCVGCKPAADFTLARVGSPELRPRKYPFITRKFATVHSACQPLLGISLCLGNPCEIHEKRENRSGDRACARAHSRRGRDLLYGGIRERLDARPIRPFAFCDVRNGSGPRGVNYN